MFQLQPGRGGKVYSTREKGVELYREKFPLLVPDWSILMQMRTLNSQSSIGSKDIVLIGQDGTALIGWRRMEMSLPGSDWIEKVSALLDETQFQVVLYKGRL